MPFRLRDGNTQGYSTAAEIAINHVVTHPLGTTFHQVGPVVLGHTEAARLAEYALIEVQ